MIRAAAGSLLTLLVLASAPGDCTAQVADQGGPTARLRLHRLTSTIFKNERTIRVLVPPGYDNKNNRRKQYPVLYLNDGQNLFDAATSVFNRMEWQVDETVTELIENGEIEPLIVVGIDNAGRGGRENEYLPYPDEFLAPPLPDPEGRKYPIFLTREVMPLVDKAYRTKPGRANTAIGGSSYGALIALFSYLQRSDKFGSLLLESPSLYVAEARILREVEEHRVLPSRIYLGVGTNESGQEDCAPGDLKHDAVQDVLKLKRIFLDRGLRDMDMKVVIEDCAVHNEAAWAGRMAEALKFLFPRK